MGTGKVRNRVVHIPRIAERPAFEIHRFVPRVVQLDELSFRFRMGIGQYLRNDDPRGRGLPRETEA